MENLDSFRGDSLFTTWRTRIATRVAISDLQTFGGSVLPRCCPCWSCSCSCRAPVVKPRRLGAKRSPAFVHSDGGVAPLFNLTGIGNLYLDNQGTQGFMYNPGNNFPIVQLSKIPRPVRHWSGAVTTLGPQLSIGLIQGAKQSGSALALPGPPRQNRAFAIDPVTILDDIPLTGC